MSREQVSHASEETRRLADRMQTVEQELLTTLGVREPLSFRARLRRTREWFLGWRGSLAHPQVLSSEVRERALDLWDQERVVAERASSAARRRRRGGDSRW